MNVVGVITLLPPAHVHINPPAPLRAAIKQGSLLHDCVCAVYNYYWKCCSCDLFYCCSLWRYCAPLSLSVLKDVCVEGERLHVSSPRQSFSLCRRVFLAAWRCCECLWVSFQIWLCSLAWWLANAYKTSGYHAQHNSAFLLLLLCKIHAASLIEFMLHPYSDLSSNRIRFLDSRSFTGLTNLTHL